MNDTEKSNLYSHLLAQYDKLDNQISSIKGEDIILMNLKNLVLEIYRLKKDKLCLNYNN